MAHRDRHVQRNPGRHRGLVENHQVRVVLWGRGRIEPVSQTPEEGHRAGNLLEDVREILGAHDRGAQLLDPLAADQGSGGVHDECCEYGVVDRDRIARLEVDVGGRVVRRRDPRGHPPNPSPHDGPRLLGHRPDGAEEEGRLRDDVVRRPGRDLGDGHDGRIEDVDAAGHRLEREHDLGGDRDGVDRLVWHRRMAAAAADSDPDDVGCRHLGAGLEMDLARRISSRDVDRERTGRPLATVDRCGVEQPFLDHRLRPAQALLAWLEHQDHAARQVRATLLEKAGGAKQHRNVGVVAAGVHRVADLGREVETRVLVEGQGVHVRAQEDRRARLSAADHGDDRAERLPRAVLDSELRELLDDHPLGLGQVESDLGLAMDAPADRNDVVLDRLRRVQ